MSPISTTEAGPCNLAKKGRESEKKHPFAAVDSSRVISRMRQALSDGQ